MPSRIEKGRATVYSTFGLAWRDFVTSRPTIFTAIIAILLLQAARAGTLIPIPLYPNSYKTTVIGINNNNVFTGGYYIAGKAESAFLGTIDGDYTPFDYPGQHEDVEGRGINRSNEIVAYVSSGGEPLAFERFSDGSEKLIKVSKEPFDYSFSGGINSKGVFVVEADVNDEQYSCYGKKARCTSDLIIFGQYYSAPRGINDHGTVVGFAAPKAWVLDNGVSAWVTYPGALYTTLAAVNNKDIATGSWTEQDGVTSHAILYDINKGEFQELKLPGLHNTYAAGINDAGLVVIGSDEGPFLYCTKKKACPKQGIEVPDGEPVKAH
jgi:hypothetical protein